jgi:hypothetical protein
MYRDHRRLRLQSQPTACRGRASLRADRIPLEWLSGDSGVRAFSGKVDPGSAENATNQES